MSLSVGLLRFANARIMNYPVLNQSGEKIGEVTIPDWALSYRVSPHLWWQTAVAQAASRRSGTAFTKTRAEVRGGGAKPWRQKGTGRARHGSIRSPIWRGGGVVGGPRPRSYRMKLPRSQRRIAFLTVMLRKLSNGSSIILDSLALDEAKTKSMLQLVDRLGCSRNVLILLQQSDSSLVRASGNLRSVKVTLLPEVLLDDLLWANSIILTRQVLDAVVEECQKWLLSPTE